MPGEDTIEMMKLRAVQGELTNLPEFNPRAPLSSRIRALLLKLTGVPQLAHTFGALELNKTTDYTGGECRGLFSEGNYLYLATENDPAKIIKFDLSDFSVHSTLTFTDIKYAYDIVSDGTYMYVGNLTTLGKIPKIRLSDFTLYDTLSLAAGEERALRLYLDGTFLYAGLNMTPSKLVKVSLDPFTEVSTLAITNPINSMCSDGNFLYLGLATNPAKIVKVDLFTFTIDSTLTLDTGLKICDALYINGLNLYAGLRTDPGKVVKIDTDTFSVKDIITFDADDKNCTSLNSDGIFLYGGVSYITGMPNYSHIVKIDLASFSRISTIKISDVVETHNLFIDGTYLYSGHASSKVARTYIYPINADANDRKIDRIDKRSVEQSMPLAFYGKITTYTDPTHFKISTLSGDFGNDFFKNWYVYVVRDAAGLGAAPQGEDAKKITDYVSSTGTFTHLAFTAPLALGDEVLILQETLALAGAGGGDYSGDIEIWDSFEYPSNASLQSKWKKSGGATSPTRSLTAFYQHYSMSIAISGVGVGEVHRAFAVPKDIGTLHNISITARSNKAAGDSFQFTLYDTAGNYSYWTQTIAAQDTWETFNIDPHSSPAGDGGTPVDLDDVIELRLANLTNASTYLFDLIKFESLVASKIGIGYDGLDDNKEVGSSVRGHLLAGLIHGTGDVIPDNKSLYSILGTGYIHDAGDFTHSIRRHLRRGVAGANATDVLAEADSLYGKIRGTPASDVIDNLNVNTEVDLITEVAQTTVAEIDAFYVDYTGWLLDGAIAGNAPTLTIRVYIDDDGGTLREVGNLRDVITESISVGKIVKIDGLGTFERNFKVTVQSSIAPNGGAASDLVKFHYTKYDKE